MRKRIQKHANNYKAFEVRLPPRRQASPGEGGEGFDSSSGHGDVFLDEDRIAVGTGGGKARAGELTPSAHTN